MLKISHHTALKNSRPFQISLHFHPSYLQQKMIDRSFWALVVLFLNKTIHYFNMQTNKNMFFHYSTSHFKYAILPLS